MRHVLNKLALVHSININNDDNTKPKLLTFRNDSELFKAFKTSKMLVRCISDGRSLLCDLVMPIPMHIPPFHHLWKMGFAIWISSTFELHYISVEMVTRVKCSSNLNGILCDFDLGILAFQHIILQIPKSTLWRSPNSLSFSLEFSFIIKFRILPLFNWIGSHFHWNDSFLMNFCQKCAAKPLRIPLCLVS